jgi:sn-glycerol 3-phosphate transport system substrate-binding protein
MLALWLASAGPDWRVMKRQILGVGALAVAVLASSCASSRSVASTTTTLAKAASSTVGSSVRVDPTIVSTTTAATIPTTTPSTSTTATTAPPSSSLGKSADCPLGALASAEKPVTIDFWFYSSGNRGDVLKAQIAKFNSSQSQIVVKAEFEGGPLGTEIFDKYSRTLGTAPGPDLVSDTGLETQSWLDSKSTVPMGACIAADGADFSDLLPAVRATGMDGTTLAAMPWGASGFDLYFNQAAFTKAGLDPNNPPTTLNEIRDTSKKIVAAGAAKHGLSILAAANVLKNFFANSGEPWALSDVVGGRADRSNGGGSFGLQLLTALHDMATAGELIAFPADDPSPDNLLAIASNDSAMAIAPAGSLGDVIAALKSGIGPGVVLGVAPFPRFGDRVSLNLEGSGAPIWLPRSGDPAKVEAAYRFAKWLMDPAQVADWVIKTGAISIRTSANAEPALQQFWAQNPFFKVGTDQVSDPSRPVLANDARIGTGAVNAAFDDAAGAALTKGADPAMALAAATKIADAAIKDYNGRSSTTG